jgi:hypothetical protein
MHGDVDRGEKARFELALPKNLNDAVVNYMMAKQSKYHQRPDSS